MKIVTFAVGEFEAGFTSDTSNPMDFCRDALYPQRNKFLTESAILGTLPQIVFVKINVRAWI